MTTTEAQNVKAPPDEIVLPKTNTPQILTKRVSTRWMRFKATLKFLRLTPGYFLAGGRIFDLNNEFDYVVIRIPHAIYTRNLLNSIFGGSLFAATDPIYLAMLLQALGEDYFAIDKSGSIEFEKPGTTDVFAVFRISEALVNEIKADCAIQRKCTRRFEVNIEDSQGQRIAKVTRTIYFRKMDVSKVNRKLKRML